MAALLTSNRVLIAFLIGLAMLPLFAAQFTVTIVNYIGLYALEIGRASCRERG